MAVPELSIKLVHRRPVVENRAGQQMNATPLRASSQRSTIE
jgi:hypothetical protein